MDFEQLYSTYFMQVYSYVMTLTGNSGEAEEITQKTFFKAFTAKKGYRGESSHLTYLCSIAKNLFYDRQRAAKKLGALEEAEDLSPEGRTVEEKVADAFDTFRIHKLLHEMEEPYKEVFQLRVFGELSFADIGRLFGKSENWARVTFYRAKNKIKEGMELQ